jgi:HEAT repeat protein
MFCQHREAACKQIGRRLRTNARSWPARAIVLVVMTAPVLLLAWGAVASRGSREFTACHLSSGGEDGHFEVAVKGELAQEAFRLVEEAKTLPTSDHVVAFSEDIVIDFVRPGDDDAKWSLALVVYDFYVGGPFASVAVGDCRGMRWSHHVPDNHFLSRVRLVAIRATAPAKAQKWAKWRADAETAGPVPNAEIPDDVPAELRPLVSNTYSRDPAQRAHAAFQLGLEGMKALPALPALVRLLGEGRVGRIMKPYGTSTRAEALAAILPLGDPAFNAVKGAFESRDCRDRAFLATVLVWLGDRKAVAPLVAALRDSDPEVRRAAAGALRLVPDPRAVDPLIAALKDQDTQVRERAAEALGRTRDPRAVARLVKALADRNLKLRARAAYALGDTRSKAAVEPLIAALSDTDVDVCVQAGGSLAKLGDRRAVEPLISLLARRGERSCERWPEVKRCAVEALGFLGDPRAIEPLTAILEDRHDEYHTVYSIAAIKALARIRDSRAVDALAKALEFKQEGGFNLMIRRAAAEALGELSGVRAAEALRKAAKEDPSGSVQDAARWSLKVLGESGTEPKE